MEPVSSCLIQDEVFLFKMCYGKNKVIYVNRITIFFPILWYVTMYFKILVKREKNCDLKKVLECFSNLNKLTKLTESF